jgi:hypothetical protein
LIAKTLVIKGDANREAESLAAVIIVQNYLLHLIRQLITQSQFQITIIANCLLNFDRMAANLTDLQ